MVDVPEEEPALPFVTVPPRVRVIGLRSAGTEGVNPKDRIGATKIDTTLIPVSAKIACAQALMDGGVVKYGEYNWRVEPVLVRTYIAAMQRHLDAFLEGEVYAEDTGILHLGHVMAGAAILIDAMSQGKFVDDRPINGNADVIAAANAWVKSDLGKSIK